ncbi:MAG: energy-coupling factor ABC transporter ATP-binding protein [Synechococcaceae cyanobacterium RL_1_2]|nr:energy-coupling factor ABC transporter ATP-binding protein [Synechococcaceae cyanobacterium RL_1_2]
MVNSTAIDIQNLSFHWPNGNQVLKDCSLQIPEGELWMLLGANGSGKSTLLRILAKMLQPQQGTISLSGRVGFVFQNPDHQLVLPTVGADVAFGLVAEGLNHRQLQTRVRQALTAVNLGAYEQRPIYALSGGQKQRVAIAGAIARRSQILLLDEPSALLDSDAQLELVTQVKELVKTQGITAVWVTHRLSELDYCDGAVFLQDGSIIDQGDPARLKNLVTDYS